MPSHDAHELTLLRSDGDSGSWPNVADPNTTGKRGYYVMVDLDEGASVNWRVKIGAHIAKYLDLPGTCHRSNFYLGLMVKKMGRDTS